ncbi:MAG: DUF4097 family beta strand repeat-containing protein [Bdellovibrionota bacterium]
MNISKQVVIFAAFLLSQLALAAPEVQTFESTKIKSIDISNDSGDVTVGVSSGLATVTYDKVKFDEKCEFVVDLIGSVLAIKTKDSSMFGGGRCQVNVTVAGPKNVSMKFKNGSGDIKVNDTVGAIEYKVGSGDVNINAEVNELHGKAGSGDLIATGLVGNAEVTSGSGAVKLTYSKCQNKTAVMLRSGSGDANLYLPSDCTVGTSFRTGSGELKNDFGISEKPNMTVSMRAGIGSLSIKRK